MKTAFASAVLALCLLVTVACADGPFSLTCQPFGTDEWEYTLYNIGPDGTAAWYLDLNWIDYWEEDQEPQQDFVITGSPKGHDWDEYTGIGYPSWFSGGMDPVPGANVSGFRIQSTEPALFFHVKYQDYNLDLHDQIGNVVVTPEPGSLIALLSGLVGLGATLRRRV